MTPLTAIRNDAGRSVGSESSTPPPDRLPWTRLALYCLVTTVFVFCSGFLMDDYVGSDNDDVLRLVNVRDLLAGQSWFDTAQYRLGLAGGTLMHWSRLIDLPIAALVWFFGFFLAPQAAEAAGLAVWPVALISPVLYGAALGCLRLGGRPAMHAGLVLASLLVIGCGRFRPGSIDHHNVQMAAIVILAAMLLDPLKKPSSFAVAAVMATIAIAIGVETTPLIAVACLLVAISWAWHGASMNAAARSFGLTLVISLSVVFFATTPPRFYTTVTCDSLSLGFYALAVAGGCALFLASMLLGHASRTVRFAGLAVCGALLAGLTLVVAPQCLQNPLDELDPLLKLLWLDNVVEAQSLADLWRRTPDKLGAAYAVGVLAMAVCLCRLLADGRDRQAYLGLVSALVLSLLIAILQVRGSIFLNLLAIFPLSAAIADLRRRSRAAPDRLQPALAMAAISLASVPNVWAVAGLALPGPTQKAALTQVSSGLSSRTGCSTRSALAPLIGEPAGVIAAPSELGAALLRYTDHRTLSGPYHRNQAGMLAELKIGMAAPDAAVAMMRDLGVTMLAYCRSDAQTRMVAAYAPDGLYAALAKDDTPAGLTPVEAPANAGLQLFRIASQPAIE